MPESTVPDPGFPRPISSAKFEWARRYVDTFGWKIFVLGRDKTPLPNCPDCRDADWNHNRENCSHLTCHGFYAATSDLNKLIVLCVRYEDGWLAVRTGSASRLVVLDFEASADAQGRTGLDTLDEFEQWTGGVELPPTLQQRTQSGGLHLLYRLQPGAVVKSRNRVLPQTDVKAEGGYVALPTPGKPERSWINGRDDLYSPLAPAPAELLDWLARARGGSSGGGRTGEPSVSVDGYDYARFLRDGCPGGARDQFFNDLIFRCRKQGMTRGQTENAARKCWEMCEQPPATEWYMPWEHVTYKLDRIWQTVEPPKLPSWRPTTTTEMKDDSTGRTCPRILRLGETA